jgi:hypothetical protein
VRQLWFFLLGGIVAVAAPVAAHHSFSADYFEERMVSMDGEVLEFQHKNPHSVLVFAAKDERGQVQRFTGEWAGVSRLTRDGVTKDTIKPGNLLVLSGSPARRPGEYRLHVKGIQRPADGWTWGRTR